MAFLHMLKSRLRYKGRIAHLLSEKQISSSHGERVNDTLETRSLADTAIRAIVESNADFDNVKTMLYYKPATHVE
jgi:hypothetical protein